MPIITNEKSYLRKIEKGEDIFNPNNNLYLYADTKPQDIILADLIPMPDPTEHASDRSRRYKEVLLKMHGGKTMVLVGSGRGAFGIDFLLNGGEHVTFFDRRATSCTTTKKNILKYGLKEKSELYLCSSEQFVKKNTRQYDILMFGTAWVTADEMRLLINNALKPGGILIQSLREDCIVPSTLAAMKVVNELCGISNITTWIAPKDDMLRLTYHALK